MTKLFDGLANRFVKRVDITSRETANSDQAARRDFRRAFFPARYDRCALCRLRYHKKPQSLTKPGGGRFSGDKSLSVLYLQAKDLTFETPWSLKGGTLSERRTVEDQARPAKL
jgi:hypothetical protein